jgi:hypothetical protein
MPSHRATLAALVLVGFLLPSTWPVAAESPRVIQVIADKDNRFKVPGQKQPVITVKAGEVIRLRITSRKGLDWHKDGWVHSFTITALKDQGWDLLLKEGTHEFTLVAPAEAGEYVVECTINCGRGHDDMRMKLLLHREGSMPTSRRGFFRLFFSGLGTLAGAWAVLKVGAANLFQGILPARSLAPTNQKWVMVIDLAKCDGCRECTKACTAMHFVPPFQNGSKCTKCGTTRPRVPLLSPVPACNVTIRRVWRLPTGATFKRTDGIVMMDRNAASAAATALRNVLIPPVSSTGVSRLTRPRSWRSLTQ